MSYEAGRRAPGIASWPTGVFSVVGWTTTKREFAMALYVSGRESVPCACEWKTLDELRVFAFSRGCTPAQFAYTVEVMGTDTRHVANYLLRHAFVSKMPMNIAQAA